MTILSCNVRATFAPSNPLTDADRGQLNWRSALSGNKIDDPGIAQGRTAQKNDEGEGDSDVVPDAILVLSVRVMRIGMRSYGLRERLYPRWDDIPRERECAWLM